MENKSINFTEMWDISKSVLAKNKDIKHSALNIPDTDKVANNVSGYVINVNGNIVARFGFFIESENKQSIDIKISADGLLACIYNQPTNIILGYGHPLGFNGLIDPQFSNVLHLGPETTQGDQVIISIENDEKFSTQGIVVIMRDVDVMVDILPLDMREDFKQSLIDAKAAIVDLNDIEKSYNTYIKHLYVILGESTIKNTQTIEEEEIYE